MFVMLLMMASGQTTIVQEASSKLAVTCATPRCGEPVKPSPYRLGTIDENGVRGVTIDDGTKCDVVGSKVCTSKPRRVFSTALNQ